jgi:hypothetical protein
MEDKELWDLYSSLVRIVKWKFLSVGTETAYRILVTKPLGKQSKMGGKGKVVPVLN